MITPSGVATTGFPNTNNSVVPNLQQQVGTFLLTKGGAPSNVLYTFSIGANDLFNILSVIDRRSDADRPL